MTGLLDLQANEESMPLIAATNEGWKLNRFSCGPPYKVETVGPYKLHQVCDARGTVAVGGPGGAVFCASEEQANELCAAANAGQLLQV